MSADPPESAAFEAGAYFDAGVALRYDQGIRLSCPGYDALHQMLIPLLRLLPAQARFLSVGAGTGAEILTLAQHFPGWIFDGVDISADMVAICRQRVTAAGLIERVHLHTGTLAELAPGPPADAASSIFVAHFIKGKAEKLAYFQSIAQRLKPGGVFVLADLYGSKGSPDFVRLLQSWLLYYTAHGIIPEKLTQDLQLILQDIDYLSEEDLFDLLRQAGFADPLRFYQTFLFGGWVANRSS